MESLALMTDVPSREFWKCQRVFLTGHTGFKGSWLSLWLLELGAEVYGFAKGVPTTPSCFVDFTIDQSVREARADVRDLSALKKEMTSFRPTIVMHLAAQPLVLESYDNPVDTFADNVMGSVNVLEAARHLPGLKIILNVTTDKVYANDSKSEAFKETDALGGIDPYSASKACSEIVTRSFAESFLLREGKSVISCRAGNVIGGGDWGADRLLPDAARSWLSGEPLKVRHSDYVRPWQHVIDCLRGYLLACEFASAQPPGLFRSWNLGPSAADLATVREVVDHFATAMGKALGRQLKWTTLERTEAPKEAGRLLLDSSRAKKDFAWMPKIPLHDALDLTADVYAEQNSNLARKTAISQILEWGMNERS